MVNVIYVGGPYYSQDALTIDSNVQLILEYLKYLWEKHEVAFSPVEAFHRPSKDAPKKDSKFWMSLCNKFLPASSEIHIILGYESDSDYRERILDSIGTMAELGYAKLYNVPVTYVVKTIDGSWKVITDF